MNILCVCGNGIGTSVLLKVNVESVAADLGVDVNVTTSDAGSAKGTANMNDLVLTSAELAPELTIIIVTHSMQQAARISDYTAFFLQEVAGEPATLIEYGQTDAIFTSPMDQRTEDYITGRFG